MPDAQTVPHTPADRAVSSLHRRVNGTFIVASSSLNTRRRHFCVMNIQIELVILAGVVVSLVALGAALLRHRRPDPKMAFLQAFLKDLPDAGDEAQESDESDYANEPAQPGAGAGSRVSDFFA
jgi:hypothetical protein